MAKRKFSATGEDRAAMNEIHRDAEISRSQCGIASRLAEIWILFADSHGVDLFLMEELRGSIEDWVKADWGPEASVKFFEKPLAAVACHPDGRKLLLARG